MPNRINSCFYTPHATDTSIDLSQKITQINTAVAERVDNLIRKHLGCQGDRIEYTLTLKRKQVTLIVQGNAPLTLTKNDQDKWIPDSTKLNHDAITQEVNEILNAIRRHSSETPKSPVLSEEPVSSTPPTSDHLKAPLEELQKRVLALESKTSTGLNPQLQEIKELIKEILEVLKTKSPHASSLQQQLDDLNQKIENLSKLSDPAEIKSQLEKAQKTVKDKKREAEELSQLMAEKTKTLDEMTKVLKEQTEKLQKLESGKRESEALQQKTAAELEAVRADLASKSKEAEALQQNLASHTTEAEALRQKLTQLEEALNKAQAESKQNAHQYDTLFRIISQSVENQAQPVDQETNSDEASRAQSESQLREAQALRDASLALCKELSEQNQALLTALELSEKNAARAQTEITQNSALVKTLEAQIAELQNQAANTKTADQQVIENLRKTIDHRKKSWTDQDQEIAGLKAENDTNKVELKKSRQSAAEFAEAFRRESAQKEQQIQEMKALLNGLTVQHSQEHQARLKAEESLANLEVQMGKNGTQVKLLEDQIAELQKKLEELKKQAADKDANHLKIQKELKKAKQDLSEAGLNLATAHSTASTNALTIAGLRAQLAAAENQLHQKEAEFNAQVKLNHSASGENDARIQQLEQQLQAAQEKIARMEKDLETHKAALAKLQQTLKEQFLEKQKSLKEAQDLLKAENST